ncbi:DUF1749 domain-containing protein [Candidatus Roizmanbacteria bacterium]|nr:MAG: DUF1749 domain-containing protein [Candidatus Roizmanbacteria bacterium]
MSTTLVHFLTTDKLRLPGLLYEPKTPTKRAAIYLHGCGSSSVFYKPVMNLWGKQFTQKNIAFFPFNNRGAHLVKSLHQETGEAEAERILGGTYYERIAECVNDIDGAITFLRANGYNTFYLIGHSTGANKIVVYNQLSKQNPVSKYILLAGGDDTGLNYEMFGEKRFQAALKRAKQEIDRGNEMKIAPKYLYPEPYTYRSLYDVLNPDGDYNTFPFYEYLHKQRLSKKPLFDMYRNIEKPMLIVYGEQDEFCFNNVNGCVEALKKNTNPKSHTTFEIISDTGHGFDGKEEELGKMMTEWLS